MNGADSGRQPGQAGSAIREGAARVSWLMIKDLLRAATLAPYMHNAQPWRFRVGAAGQVIELYADPARMLPYADPHGRALHIGCGAALFNLRLAALVAGRQPVVRLLPDPDTQDLLATVRLAGPHQPRPGELDLHAAIAARHTNRGPFSNRRVPPGVLAELTEAAQMEGAVLHVLDEAETVRVLELAREAERELLADPRYRAELARWTTGPRDRDGIPDSALGPQDMDGRAPVREFAPGRAAPFAWFEESPQLTVLATRSNERADWLRAGQAMQRVLLTATMRGISASPLTQPLEVPDAWLVRDPRSGIEHPQMILRIGYGLPVPPTPRRPVGDVLDT